MSLNLIVLNKNEVYMGGDGACTLDGQRIVWNVRKVHQVGRFLIAACGHANIVANIVEHFDSLPASVQSWTTFKNVVEKYAAERGLTPQNAGDDMHYVFCFVEWDGDGICYSLLDSTGFCHRTVPEESWQVLGLGVDIVPARNILLEQLEHNINPADAIEYAYAKMQSEKIGGKCCIYHLDKNRNILHREFILDMLGDKLISESSDERMKYYSLVAENININSILQVVNSGGTTKIHGGAIQTGSITANQIDATNLKVNAANIIDKLTVNQIDATNLIAQKIGVGSGLIALEERDGELYANFNGAGAWSKSLTSSPAAYNRIGVNNATWYASDRNQITFQDSSNIRLSTDTNNQTIQFVYTGTPSDQRLKENIVPTKNSTMEVLSKIEVVDFNYVGKETTHTGLIAQEVQKVFPNAVTERTDGMLAVDYTTLVPLVIKALQEQKSQINTLKMALQERNNG